MESFLDGNSFIAGGVPLQISSVLGGVVVALSALRAVLPSLDEGLALVPHHTVFSPVPACPIPFFWNLATAHFFEGHLLKAVLVVPWLVALARMLERLWTMRGLATHLAFTAAHSGLAVFVMEVIQIYRTHQEKDFFSPLRGCSGLLVALAVGLRHAYPLEALPLVPRQWGMQCQHLPFALTASMVLVGFLLPSLLPEWQFAPWALFFAWFHLRYVMWYPYAKAHGDHSAEFSFESLFPKALRPLIGCLGSIAYACGTAVAPGFIKLREADAASGSVIVYDRSAAGRGPVDLEALTSGLPSLGGLSDLSGNALQEARAEYNARREKALALLEENINSLLAPGVSVGKSSTKKSDDLAGVGKEAFRTNGNGNHVDGIGHGDVQLNGLGNKDL